MRQDAVTRATAILTTRYDVEVEAAHSLLTRLARLYEQSPTEAALTLIATAARDPMPTQPRECRLETADDLSSWRPPPSRRGTCLRDLPNLSPADMLFTVDEIVGAAARHVPGARYAGITALHRHQHVDTTSATGRYPAILDVVQDRHHQGPCLEAIQRHDIVRVDDLSADRRWPKYRREALSHTPIRSILSVPMSVNHTRTSSALNFYAEDTGAFDDQSTDHAAAFASYATLAWTILRRDIQFCRALASRDIIGQAKGMLMERFEVDAESAFNLLKKLSQDSNVPLAEVARRLRPRQAIRDASAPVGEW